MDLQKLLDLFQVALGLSITTHVLDDQEVELKSDSSLFKSDDPFILYTCNLHSTEAIIQSCKNDDHRCWKELEGYAKRV